MCSRKQAVGWEARRKVQSRFGGRKNDWKWTEPVEAGLGPPQIFLVSFAVTGKMQVKRTSGTLAQPEFERPRAN